MIFKVKSGGKNSLKASSTSGPYIGNQDILIYDNFKTANSYSYMGCAYNFSLCAQTSCTSLGPGMFLAGNSMFTVSELEVYQTNIPLTGSGFNVPASVMSTISCPTSAITALIPTTKTSTSTTPKSETTDLKTPSNLSISPLKKLFYRYFFRRIH